MLPFVRLYYVSMWFELRNDEMSWKQGVWFRMTGIVPYNHMTNLDVIQGPVMRMLGISTLSIQQDTPGRMFRRFGLKGLSMRKIYVN